MQNYASGQEPESVYNLLPAYQAPVQKAALYRSKVTVLYQLCWHKYQAFSHQRAAMLACSTRAQSTQSSLRWV